MIRLNFPSGLLSGSRQALLIVTCLATPVLLASTTLAAPMPANEIEIDTSGLVDDHEITVYAVGFDRWAKSYVAEHECATRQGVAYTGDVPSDELELDQFRFDMCIFAETALRKAPQRRMDDYTRRYAKIVEKIQTCKDPARLRKLATKAADLLGRRWELEQLVNRSMGGGCDPDPADLVLKFGGSTEGARSVHYAIKVDRSMCGS